jgi:hypothetical protein
MCTFQTYFDSYYKTLRQKHETQIDKIQPLQRGLKKRKRGSITSGDIENANDRYCRLGSSGVLQLKTLITLLDHLGKNKYIRTQVQRDIHKGMVGAVVPRLFMNDTESTLQKALRDNNIQKTKQQFMVLAGRRVGKTIATSLFVSAYLLSVPSCNICVFSTGKRASNLFLQEVKAMLSSDTDISSLIKTDNSEHLVLDVDGDPRKISSFPGNARTLRGVGGDLLILEEAAHIKADVFYEVIVPLMGLSTTSVLAISTPGTSDNWYSTLLQKRDSRNDMIFSSYTARNVCISCRLNRAESTCMHAAAEIAPWKSKNKREVTEAMYSDNKTLALRELSGVVADDVNAAYNRILVEQLFLKPRFCAAGTPPLIFTAIDPCGGGASRFAMASVFLTVSPNSKNTLEFVLCGAENQEARNQDDVKLIVLSHMSALRCLYPFSEICVGVESNLGMEASNIGNMLRGQQNLRCLEETKNKDGLLSAGFTTTHARKLQYFELTQTAITRSAFHVSGNFVATDEAAILKELEKQLLSYKRILSKPTNPFATEKQTFSGKVDGTGKMAPDRLCDDLLLAVQMAIFISLLVSDDKAISVPRSAYNEIALTCQ